MARFVFEAFIRALDSNGAVAPGAKLNVYEAGSTTPVTTYSDDQFNFPQANPILADAAGFFPQVYIKNKGLYKARVTTADDVLIEEHDYINQGGEDPLEFNTVALLIADTTLAYSGAGQIVSAGDIVRVLDGGYSYEVAASGASDNDVITAGSVKLYVLPSGDTWHVEAFGVTADGTDETTEIQAAINAVETRSKGTLRFGPGTYGVSSALTIKQGNVNIIGAGTASSIKALSAMTNVIEIDNATADKEYTYIRGIRVDGNNVATNGIYVERWHNIRFTQVNFISIKDGYGFKITCEDGSTDTELLVFDMCEGFKGTGSYLGLANVFAGAGGEVTEAQFYNCHVSQPSGWAFRLTDVSRSYFEHVFAGNGSATFDGCILIESTGAAAGKAGEPGKHVINGVHFEDPSAGTAIGVHIDSTDTTGAGNGIRGCIIEGVDANPPTATLVKLTTTNAGRVRDNFIGTMRQPVYSSDNIDIGAGVTNTNIRVSPVQGDQNKTGITDAGTRTRINGILGPTGIGAKFVAAENMDVGDIIESNQTHMAFLRGRLGYMIRLGIGAFYQSFDGSPNTLASVKYDALTAPFAVGEGLTGGTSGATATVRSIVPINATSGYLNIDARSGGATTFVDNETITGSESGSATADGAEFTGWAGPTGGLYFRQDSTIASRTLYICENVGGTSFEWRPVGNRVANTTALGSASNVNNTEDKFTGTQVYASDVDALFVATGSGTTDVWASQLSGQADITPS